MVGDKGFIAFKEGQATFGDRHKGWALVFLAHMEVSTKKMVQNHLRVTMYTHEVLSPVFEVIDSFILGETPLLCRSASVSHDISCCKF